MISILHTKHKDEENKTPAMKRFHIYLAFKLKFETCIEINKSWW